MKKESELMSELILISGPHFQLLNLAKTYQSQKSYQKTTQATSFQAQIIFFPNLQRHVNKAL